MASRLLAGSGRNGGQLATCPVFGDDRQILGLKYEGFHGRCPDQPCPNCGAFKPRCVVAFRFMHSPAMAGDFDPPALLGGRTPNDNDKCENFALSFFDSVDSARTKYRSLAQRVDAESRYGGHIGKISISESDGLMSEPSRRGHMDLHPEDVASFLARVDAYCEASVTDDEPLTGQQSNAP